MRRQAFALPTVGAYASYCLRVNPNTILPGTEEDFEVDIWNQDIGGDASQQFKPVSQGSVYYDGANSWPFSDESLDNTYNGNPVYTLESYNSFHKYYQCVGAGGYENLVATESCTGANGVLWVLDGSGHFVNVYQSDYYGSSQDLQSPTDYNETYTTQAGSGSTKWNFINSN